MAIIQVEPNFKGVQNFSSSTEMFSRSLSLSLSYRRDVRLIWGTVVVGHERVELQGVELEAGVVDVLHVLHGVLVHGQQGGRLEGEESELTRSSRIVHLRIVLGQKHVMRHSSRVSSAITLPVRVWTGARLHAFCFLFCFFTFRFS